MRQDSRKGIVLFSKERDAEHRANAYSRFQRQMFRAKGSIHRLPWPRPARRLHHRGDFNLTKIDRWFLVQIKEIVDFEVELAAANK